MAIVQRHRAKVKLPTKPKNEKEITQYAIPGIAPAAFMIPKTLPECFGAKSCGLINTPAL